VGVSLDQRLPPPPDRVYAAALYSFEIQDLQKNLFHSGRVAAVPRTGKQRESGPESSVTADRKAA